MPDEYVAIGRPIASPRPGELDDIVHLRLDLVAAETHRETAEHDVPIARQCRFQRGIHSEQPRPPSHLDDAARQRLQAGDGAKQRRLARPVRADDAERFADMDLERDILHRVDERRSSTPEPATDEFPRAEELLLVDPVADVGMLDVDAHRGALLRVPSTAASSVTGVALLAGPEPEEPSHTEHHRPHGPREDQDEVEVAAEDASSARP